MTTHTEHLQLSAADKQSTLWARVESHLERRLHNLRRQNDSLEIDEKQAAQLRGRIAEIKLLLELGKTRPDLVVPNL